MRYFTLLSVSRGNRPNPQNEIHTDTAGVETARVGEANLRERIVSQ